MSNITSEASNVSNPRQRSFVNGVPKSCWCGSSMVVKLSKSEANPYRRYYRCSFAVIRKVDEGILDEIKSIAVSIEKLEKDVRVKTSEIEEQQKIWFEKMENELIMKVEGTLTSVKSQIKQANLVGVFGCVIIVGLTKFVG